MTTPAIWDGGLWDDANWDTLLVSGAITEGPDVVNGAVTVIYPVVGDITESPDVVDGQVTVLYPVVGDITEGPDVADGQVTVIYPVVGDITEAEDQVAGYVNAGTAVYGDITENPDIVEGAIKVPGRPGGGWAPQFNIRREWEIIPEPVVEEVVEEVFEPDPEAVFVSQALPLDPAVERIIQTILQGPQVVDTDDDDVENLLMYL